MTMTPSAFDGRSAHPDRSRLTYTVIGSPGALSRQCRLREGASSAFPVRDKRVRPFPREDRGEGRVPAITARRRLHGTAQTCERIVRLRFAPDDLHPFAEFAGLPFIPMLASDLRGPSILQTKSTFRWRNRAPPSLSLAMDP
jgi:hypothetical protein